MLVRITKKRVILAVILLLILGTAAHLVLSGTGNVTIISEGSEHDGFVHYFHFRSGSWATAGAPWQVQSGNPDAFYLVPIQDQPRPRRIERERVYADSVLDLLEADEYIVQVFVSWGNARSGHEAQYLFRLIRAVEP